MPAIFQDRSWHASFLVPKRSPDSGDMDPVKFSRPTDVIAKDDEEMGAT